MNNKTITDNKFTVATTQKVQAGGDVKVFKQTIKRPVEVILTLGIFFDGTNNNSLNTQIRKNYQQQLARGEEVAQPNSVYSTSHCNEDSNVYKLSQMYAFDDKLSDKNSENIAHYQQRIYIEGVGTQTGKNDNIYGLGTAFGSTGIDAKIARGIAEIRDQLVKFIKDNRQVKIRQLQFDVFGFSRGAATARYFANIVADQLTDSKRNGSNNPLTAAIKPIIDPFRSRHWQGNINGEVRFLGIFDTVAGLGAINNLFDAGDGETFNVDIHIRQQSAKHGLDLQAAHEYRHNFSLNDVPPFFNKVILPGAHSDIGGGYDNTPVIEDLYLCKIHQKTAVLFHDITATKEYIKADLRDELAKIRRHPGLKYIFHNVNETHFQIWGEQSHIHDSTTQDIYGVIRFKRTVKAGLDRIALRIMYDEAIVKGCKFIPFIEKHSIPIELVPVANKLLAAAKQYQSYQLNEAEKHLVLGEYTHSSSEYERNIPTKIGTKQVIDQQSGQEKTIPWVQNVTKEGDAYKVALIKVHVPNLDREGMWQRLIHAN